MLLGNACDRYNYMSWNVDLFPRESTIRSSPCNDRNQCRWLRWRSANVAHMVQCNYQGDPYVHRCIFATSLPRRRKLDGKWKTVNMGSPAHKNEQNKQREWEHVSQLIKGQTRPRRQGLWCWRAKLEKTHRRCSKSRHLWGFALDHADTKAESTSRGGGVCTLFKCAQQRRGVNQKQTRTNWLQVFDTIWPTQNKTNVHKYKGSSNWETTSLYHKQRTL